MAVRFRPFGGETIPIGFELHGTDQALIEYLGHRRIHKVMINETTTVGTGVTYISDRFIQLLYILSAQGHITSLLPVPQSHHFPVQAYTGPQLQPLENLPIRFLWISRYLEKYGCSNQSACRSEVSRLPPKEPSIKGNFVTIVTFSSRTGSNGGLNGLTTVPPALGYKTAL
ncbi:hypothetical protein BDM02DRAFT_3260231 [Thelephora ganbajun]|uniref:Uncharacterized protein n=1 Tax=Thelephora ganbajun TaxID=370292 RepID=A0ACB6ZJL2_THEGA|nr:hypothetical protein BDM02DRAFT_3260231 [Thelephora ganbajun]